MAVYKMIKVDGKNVPEHRHIIEQHLSRKLSDDEVVHHINGDKKDNRIENLQVMTKKEHLQFHHNNETRFNPYPKVERRPNVKGNNFTLERIKKNLLQKDIAKVLDLNVNTYCKKENNIKLFTLEELVNLSNFYKCSIDYLAEGFK